MLLEFKKEFTRKMYQKLSWMLLICKIRKPLNPWFFEKDDYIVFILNADILYAVHKSHVIVDLVNKIVLGIIF